MTQLLPFMNLDTQMPAPFDYLLFRIIDINEEYSFPLQPEYLVTVRECRTFSNKLIANMLEILYP